MYFFITFVVSLLLMPFFTKHESKVDKCVFLALSTMLTPILGIPLYLCYDHRF